MAGGVILVAAVYELTPVKARCLRHCRDTGLLGPGVIPALLAMQLVWFLTWIPGSEQGIVTGLAIAVAAARLWCRYRPAAPPPGTGQRQLTATGTGGR